MSILGMIRAFIGITISLVFLGIGLSFYMPGSGFMWASNVMGADHPGISGARMGINFQIGLGLFGVFSWCAYLVRKFMTAGR